ncbi:hypothetical protein CLIM01_10131 [Colletotrichum limetticola]|uniref:Uncharacterized protein n=1 Tax=Colletotrichum limetticola TaxID=1209924 RepID=A0ABQ9PKL2_9PEZI|nr:hypothetical protein CLIM01_10131 [Colletotrichum limetticola]
MDILRQLNHRDHNHTFKHQFTPIFCIFHHYVIQCDNHCRIPNFSVTVIVSEHYKHLFVNIFVVVVDLSDCARSRSFDLIGFFKLRRFFQHFRDRKRRKHILDFYGQLRVVKYHSQSGHLTLATDYLKWFFNVNFKLKYFRCDLVVDFSLKSLQHKSRLIGDREHIIDADYIQPLVKRFFLHNPDLECCYVAFDIKQHLSGPELKFL